MIRRCASGLRRRQQIETVLHDRYPGRLVCEVPEYGEEIASLSISTMQAEMITPCGRFWRIFEPPFV